MKESVKENIKPLIFIVVVLVLAAVSAYPQRILGGKVVEVLDGKTCVIEMPNGRVTAVLQYIEIPEPDQPLHNMVREHLQTLILDKTVEFHLHGVKQDKVVGGLFLKGVDISQQMLRDGAAWYSIPEKSSQNEAQTLLYQDNETQAKTEKRGVWGVENLKPAWEYRAEKEALRIKQEQETLEEVRLAARMRTAPKTPVQQKTVAQTEMWAEIEGAAQYNQPYGIGELRKGYKPEKDVSFIFTPSIFPDFPEDSFLKKVEARFIYAYRGVNLRAGEEGYGIGFLTASKEYKFVKSSNLTIIADSQKIVLKRLVRLFQRDNSVNYEYMLFKISRAQSMKIAGAKKISIRLGTYSGTISADSLMYLNNLMNAT